MDLNILLLMPAFFLAGCEIGGIEVVYKLRKHGVVEGKKWRYTAVKKDVPK